MGTLKLPYGTGERRVAVAPQADISRRFRPGGRDEEMLARALQLVAQTDVDTNRIVICKQLEINTIVTVVANDEVMSDGVKFGVFAGHQAKNPGQSPFVHLNGMWPKTDTLVLDFQNGQLVRVMPGKAYPPLPWMGSAKGRREASKAFWRTNSYIATPWNVVDGVLVNEPPSWYI